MAPLKLTAEAAGNAELDGKVFQMLAAAPTSQLDIGGALLTAEPLRRLRRLFTARQHTCHGFGTQQLKVVFTIIRRGIIGAVIAMVCATKLSRPCVDQVWKGKPGKQGPAAVLSGPIARSSLERLVNDVAALTTNKYRARD